METLIIGWLVIISVFIIYSLSVLFKLFSVKNRGLRQSIFDSIEGNKKITNDLSVLRVAFEKHTIEADSHLQKTALVRFNPFERMGGEQSYSLAILDNKASGIVITFLYTKEGVRTYIKEVLLGKAKDIDLSKEEKEAITLASRSRIIN